MGKSSISKTLLAIALIIPSVVHAIENNIDPIDKMFTECIGKNSTTAGINICAQEALKSWDKELNNAYKNLINKLPKNTAAVLKYSQIEWVKYRDKEFKFIDEYYDGLEGSIYSNMNYGNRIDFVKQRVLKLRSYLGILNMK